jgi:hypothetical protein
MITSLFTPALEIFENEGSLSAFAESGKRATVKCSR